MDLAWLYDRAQCTAVRREAGGRLLGLLGKQAAVSPPPPVPLAPLQAVECGAAGAAWLGTAMSAICTGATAPAVGCGIGSSPESSEAAAVVCECVAAIGDDWAELPVPVHARPSLLLAAADGLLLVLALTLLAAECQRANASASAVYPAGVIPTLQDLAKGTPATKKQLHFGAGHTSAQQREMV